MLALTLALALLELLLAAAEVVVKPAVADLLAAEYVRATVVGIVEPLVPSSAESVVQRPAFPGQVPVRFRSLSNGPVGL